MPFFRTAMGQYNSPILKEPLVQRLADKYGKQPGSILLSWGVQRGFSVVPKSSNPDRLRQNRGLSPPLLPRSVLSSFN